MGVTVRQKSKGKGQPWWVFVNHNGKRKSKQIGDKKAALKVASAIRERLSTGDFKLGGRKKIPTFLVSCGSGGLTDAASFRIQRTTRAERLICQTS